MTARRECDINTRAGTSRHDMESYRSGHNGAVLKTVRRQRHGGSNPSLSATSELSTLCSKTDSSLELSVSSSELPCSSFPNRTRSAGLRNKKKKVKAVAAGLLRICCTIHRERNQVEISPGKEYLALQRNMCMMRLYAVSQVPSRMPVFLYNANVFRKH